MKKLTKGNLEASFFWCQKVLKFLICALFVCAFSFSLYSEEKDTEKSQNEIEKQIDILNYGLESDITELITDLTKEKDAFLVDEIKKMFDTTRNVNVRKKIIYYFQVLENDSLKDFCLDFLLDPYEEETEYVAQVMQYVSALKIKEASPEILDILKSDNEQFKNMSITALGLIGGKEEADYLIEYFHDEELDVIEKQTILKALGNLALVETYDDLIEIATDDDENTFVRRYAIEAASKMGKNDVVKILSEMSHSSDPNIRSVVVQSAGNFVSNEKSECNADALIIILDGLKDNHQNVRMESVKVCREKKLSDAEKILLFRAKNDPVANIKYECYYALAGIGSKDCADFLSSVMKDEKMNETARAKAVDAVLEYNVTLCYDDVKKVAEKALDDDKLKNLRYAIGKSLANHDNLNFEPTCLEFLKSKDVATKGTGIDIYNRNNYIAARPLIEEIAASEEKSNPLKKKASLVLEKTKNR
mgnify:CR=1 FL=1